MNLKSSPDLSHINYLLFGLGDMTYKDTFAQGVGKFDDLFFSLNAKRITDHSIMTFLMER